MNKKGMRRRWYKQVFRNSDYPFDYITREVYGSKKFFILGMIANPLTDECGWYVPTPESEKK